MKILIYMGLCLVFMVVIYWPYFGTLDTFTWGDWGWYFPETAKTWFDFPRIWFTGSMGGIDVSIFQYVPNRLLYGALAQNFPFEVFDRAVFILPSVIFPTVSAFLLIKYLSRSSTAAAVGSMVFSLNSYMATTRTGHFTLSNSFALAPLVLMFVIKSIEERKMVYAVIAGLVSAVAFAYEPRAFLLTWVVAGGYGIFNLLFTRHENLWTRVKQLGYLIIPIVMVGALHFYAFIGYYFAAQIISSQILNRALFGAGYVNIDRALAMAIYFWDEYSGKPQQTIPLYFWITTVTSMAGMWLGRKNKFVIFFTLVALGGIFLNKHTNQPFGELYVWLYKYIPGFNAFREPSKFYFFTGLGYSVLTGWFVAWAVSQKNRLKAAMLTGLAVLPFILNGITISQGKIGKLMTPRHVPEEYLVLKNFLLDHPGNYRVLHVPFEVKWGYWDEHIRKSSAAEYVLKQWADIFPYKPDDVDFSYFNYTMSLFSKPESNYLLDLASVRYVFVPSNDTANEDIFTFSWGSREDFLSRIESLNYLKRVDAGHPLLDVFENQGWRPLIYVAQGLENIDLSPQTIAVDYTQLKTFHYEIELEDMANQAGNRIYYTDLYHPGWKLYYGRISWVDALLGRKLVPGVEHSQSIVHTNQFILPQEVDTALLTLYFEPQAKIYVGVIVSLVSLTVIVGGLVIYWLKRKHDSQ